MKFVTTCPCCSNQLLHHFDRNREYWFCRHCWQEMPAFLEEQEIKRFAVNKIVNLSDKLVPLNKVIAS